MCYSGAWATEHDRCHRFVLADGDGRPEACPVGASHVRVARWPGADGSVDEPERTEQLGLVAI